MSFLDTIGQRGPESRPQGTQSPIAQDLTFDSPAPAIQTPAAQEPPQSNRIHAVVIWSAALIVIAAVAVGAWLGVRHFATVVTPAKEASADAPPATEAPAEEPRPKRRPVRPEAAVRSAAPRRIAIDAGPPETGAEGASETSVSTIGPATKVANVSETEAAPIEALADPIAATLIAELSEDNSVYSREGTGVVPPRLLSLGFVRPLVNGFDTRTSRLELVVSKSGTVEEAKIFPPSRNWQDAMLLSRAKTFQFVPAQRNGSPVRYRFVMEVDTTP
jgi:hypothetical protein